MADQIRQPHHDFEMAIPLKHHAGVPAANSRPDDVLHRRETEAAPGYRSLVHLDFQHRKAARLLDLDVGCAFGGLQDRRNLAGGPQ